jgi:hypothetical protein
MGLPKLTHLRHHQPLRPLAARRQWLHLARPARPERRRPWGLCDSRVRSASAYLRTIALTFSDTFGGYYSALSRLGLRDGRRCDRLY